LARSQVYYAIFPHRVAAEITDNANCVMKNNNYLMKKTAPSNNLVYLDLTRWYRSSFSLISSRRWCFWWNWWPWLVRCPLQLRQRRAPCQTTSITAKDNIITISNN